MKKAILIISILIFQAAALPGQSDSLLCYLDRKVETPEKQIIIEHPWRYVADIPVVFDYRNNEIKVYAKETLTLSLGSMSNYYSRDGDDSLVDWYAKDHRGISVTCTMLPGKEEGEEGILIVRYCNVQLQYKLKKNK